LLLLLLLLLLCLHANCSDYVEHFESSHVQGFLDTLAENDVPWSLTPLYRPDVAELVSCVGIVCSSACHLLAAVSTCGQCQ
jgi:hypothetical protein